MRRICALSLLLGAVLTITYCTHSTPTSTINPTLASTYVPSSTPDLGLHLLVDVKGDLRYKQPGWKEYLPLSFGTALNRGDLLQAAPGAEGLVVCADLSLASVPPGYDGGLPCLQAEPLLLRHESPVVGPRRNAPPDSAIPYVLRPRHTFIQTGHPLLRWHPSDTAAITYTVRVWGSEVDWQAETTATEVRYPQTAPSLEPEVPYHLTVVDDAGHSSAEEQTALDLSFARLAPDEVVAAQTLATKVHTLNLSGRATRLLEAEIDIVYGLRADAIARLEELATNETAPAIPRRLGELYLEVGLYTEAQEAYEYSLAGYRALGDWAGEAASLVGQGLAHLCNGDDATGQEYLEQAIRLYEAIGDADGVLRVEGVLAGIER